MDVQTFLDVSQMSLEELKTNWTLKGAKINVVLHCTFVKINPTAYGLDERGQENHQEATQRWLCDCSLGEDKVRDYCHFTGKYRGAAHNQCNLKYKMPKFIPVFFHNLAGYDSHLFTKNLGSTPGQLTCIPNSEEKYISFSKTFQVSEYKIKDGEMKPLHQSLRATLRRLRDEECTTYIAILVLSRQCYQLRRARRLHCEEYLANKTVYTGNVWDEAKAHLLAIINGRQAKLTLKDPKWYQEFYNRMRHITDSIVKLQPDLYEQAKNSKECQCATRTNFPGACRLFRESRRSNDEKSPSPDMDEGYAIPVEVPAMDESLLLRQSVYPVDYMDGFKQFEETEQEEKALMAAFDSLTRQGIAFGSLEVNGRTINKDNEIAGCSQRVKEVMDGKMINLLTRRGSVLMNVYSCERVYPYDYVDGFEKLQEIELPPSEAFYNTITGEECHPDYELIRAASVKRDGYHQHERYLTAPILAYDATLKTTVTVVKPKLISYLDMLLMLEKGIRGGITVATQRFAKVNNPYVEECNADKPINYLMYVDADNLYGWDMSNYPPTGGFEWINTEEMPTLETLALKTTNLYGG
ncbi:unnamed protein product [Mytilus edulis]|uniref:DNA-directed DNA polymerase n=1 Tax=Mytilus edulis TaxID=6550 RepID=A0A8S3QHH4_MYTED|nr:unnamed protein product [Mytilus edulis]